ncbi:MAG: XkdF-like putative serine protease domain-containing protein, partial [Gammaproteobacteria bacterium]|nr:XkdF-like putative serine protease domain-containing protein [Gammaproteobacteria bacterium]
MELIELNIPDGEQLDFQVALVDQPAIESDWIAFDKVKQTFQVESKDKRIVSGYAMIADLPIFRRDEQRGEYHVVFRKDAIQKIALNFMRNGLTKNTNLDHSTGAFQQGVYVFESFMIDSERGIKAPDKFNQEADGSWFISMKVEDDKVWKSVLDGTFKGFSVEGLFEE